MRSLQFCLLPLILLVAACSHPPIPGQKVGKPYVVDGKTYYPGADPDYDEIGQASWYGPGFHGKNTASGESYDQNELTAAHPTLPLPSLVRVTNLENGRSLIVRVNDRGPFVKNRIIDLSKKSAEQLGVRSTARVRLQYLKAETEKYIADSQRNGEYLDMADYNDNADRNAQQALAAAAPAEAAPEIDTEVADNEPEPAPTQIVEETSEMTHAGQAIDNVAPIMSVGETDLAAPTAQPAAAPVKTAAAKPPAKTISLVKNAWADDANEPAPAAKPGVKYLTVGTPKGHIPPPAAAPVAAAPAPASGAFSIQAGVFSSEDNAHKLAGKLKGAGSVNVEAVSVGGKSLWRVRVGSFSAREEADAALEKVQGAGIADARVVRL